MKNCIIDIALEEFGIKEIVGKDHNPKVLKYFKETGHSWINDDETAWCSAFMNWVAMTAGAKTSGKLNARSWLSVGKEVESPEKGDVAVFWRGSRDSWKGHVAIFIRETKNFIYVLGGNQGNKVCIQAYRKDRLLQYRDIS